MASLNIILCIVIFSAVALGRDVPNTRREHNIDLCDSPSPTTEWTPYYSTTIEAPAKFLQIVTRELKWPTGGETPDKIRCIRVTDVKADGTGGYATIHDGGLNFNHLTIHMESQRNYGLLFKIEILGEPAVPKPTGAY